MIFPAASRSLFLLGGSLCEDDSYSCGRGLFGKKWTIHKSQQAGDCEEQCSGLFTRFRLRNDWSCGPCPSLAPSLAPSLVPSLQPSQAPSPDPECTNTPFTSSQELQAAVDDYLSDNSPGTDVAIMYGHPINSWCVGEISDFTGLFYASRNSNASAFNENIGSWDVSRATTFYRMFNGAEAFNQDLRWWNTSSVTRMTEMFQAARAFNGDVTIWDTSALQGSLFITFGEAESFNQDLSQWNVSKVTAMRSLFDGATAFNGDVSTWNVEKVISMDAMFRGTKFNHNLSSWQTGKVTIMAEMFYNNSDFNGDVTQFNTSSVTDIAGMFQFDTSFNQDLSGWDISQVFKIRDLFRGASSFNQDLCDWGLSINASLITEKERMFLNTDCPSKDSPDLTAEPKGPFCAICPAP